MSYETFRPDTRSSRSRSDNLAHTLISTPVPAARSAQASSRVVARDKPSPLDGDGNGESVLDHLPPLDLPARSPRRPRRRRSLRRPSGSRRARPRPRLRPRRATISVVARPASPTLALTGSAPPAPEPASSAGGRPASPGSSPSISSSRAAAYPPRPGWTGWPRRGTRPSSISANPPRPTCRSSPRSTRRGLRYIALPVNLKSIDRAHVARFNFELALSEARPLYFFDTDGTRAGTLWYIRRIAVDRVDSQIARREAEELGLNNPDYWLAATSYLERLDNLRSQALDATGPVSTADPQEAKASAPQPVRSQTLTGPTTLAPASSPAPSTAAAPSDPTAWHPYAAIVITGLTFPLGYWGRSVVPTILARTPASLPAPARRSRSLPRALDA